LDVCKGDEDEIVELKSSGRSSRAFGVWRWPPKFAGGGWAKRVDD